MDYLVIPYPGGDERWHVKHGNDQVPVLAAKALPAGTVQLESPLQALIKRSDGTYELRFGGSAPSRPVIADHVILTIPWTTLREVDLEGAGFGSYRMTAIRELGMGTDVKLIVQYHRRPAKFKVHGRPWSGTVNYTDPNYQTWDSAPRSRCCRHSASRCHPASPRCRTRGYPASTSGSATAGNSGVGGPADGHPAGASAAFWPAGMRLERTLG
jgi:hypothetical protein